MPTSGAYAWSRGGRRLPSNQPHAALEGQERKRPLGHDDDAVAKTDQPEDVQEDPEEPRRKPGHLQSEDVADRRPATDGGHRAEVLVAERLERTPVDGAQDVARRVPSLLHRDLRDARQRLAILYERTHVARDERRRMTGQRQRWLGADAAGPIQRHTQRLRER